MESQPSGGAAGSRATTSDDILSRLSSNAINISPPSWPLLMVVAVVVVVFHVCVSPTSKATRAYGAASWPTTIESERPDRIGSYPIGASRCS